MTEAVVVGSGPNGLAAALTLAAAGVGVRVIEAADTLGGGMRSSELTVPGLVHDECSAFHPFALASEFARRFELEDAGLAWRWAPLEAAHPLDGGRGAVLSRSVADTATGLGTDGPSWASMFGPLTQHFDALSAEILRPVLHMPHHPVKLARFGAHAALPAVRLARRWHTHEAQALFGGVAAHALRPLESPLSSAIGLALTTAAHACGWPVAEGGSVALRDAIVTRAKEHEVLFETGRRVESLDEFPEVDLVMLDTSPAAAALLTGARLPARVQRAYRRFRHGPGAFKMDFAVEGGVPWAYEPAGSAGTVHVGGTLQQMAASERDVTRGRMPEHPFVLVGQQSVADPTRRSGSLQPIYAYAHVPHGYTGDATSALIRQIERFAPGFRERVVATHVRSVPSMASYNANYVGGDIVTGRNDVRQMVFGPRLTLRPYATGAPGIYLCSAATPPGAGTHGMCGFLAAQAALRSVAG